MMVMCVPSVVPLSHSAVIIPVVLTGEYGSKEVVCNGCNMHTPLWGTSW